MALIKILRGGMLTLPAPLRKTLRVGEGDYLEAEMVGEGVLLKPMKVVDRQAAWRKVRQAQAAVRYTGPEPRPDAETEERWIADTLEEERDRHA